MVLGTWPNSRPGSRSAQNYLPITGGDQEGTLPWRASCAGDWGGGRAGDTQTPWARTGLCCSRVSSCLQEKCHQYWPAERSARYQYFVVDPMAEYNMPQYILREFKVTDARVSGAGGALGMSLPWEPLFGAGIPSRAQQAVTPGAVLVSRGRSRRPGCVSVLALAPSQHPSSDRGCQAPGLGLHLHLSQAWLGRASGDLPCPLRPGVPTGQRSVTLGSVRRTQCERRVRPRTAEGNETCPGRLSSSAEPGP